MCYHSNVVELPKEIVWDYPEAPADATWRRKRLAMFFPRFGRDRNSVTELFDHRAELDAPPEVVALIELYAEAWARRK